MKTNELRIGNLVKRSQHSNWQERHWGEEVKVGFNEMQLISFEKTTEWYEPIPLKEGWLLKHGFFVENFDYSIPISDCKVVWLTLIPQDEDCTAYSVCVTQTDEDEDDQNVFLSDISYVHQVQNLYFALTGNELKYEEQS